VIVRHVLVGGLFTLVGLFSLLVPEVPFICIGALIFGPVELFAGLFGTNKPRRSGHRIAVARGQGPPSSFVPASEESVRFCTQCGMKNDAVQTYCTNCGVRLS